MAGFNFADRYKAAGLTPGPEIIRLRQEPFDKLRKAMSVDRVITLVRLLFGLSEPDKSNNTWFREAFAETDPSFSMLDNAREAAVLSSCLLSAAFQEHDKGHIEAALAVLTTAANIRMPHVMPTLIDDAQHHLDVFSVKMRTPPEVDVSTISVPIPSEDAEGQEVEEDQSGITDLAQQTHEVISSLVRYTGLLREELEMLWWYVGGWSKVLDKPFGELDLSVAAVMAGIDFAALVRTPPGPVAARAILHRLIWTGRKSKSASIPVKDAVDALPDDTLQQLKFGDALKSVPDLCPVLSALRKAAEIGKGTAWHGAFRKVTGFKEDLAFKPLDLAMQVYREAMLIALIDEANSA